MKKEDLERLNTDDLSQGFWELNVPSARIISPIELCAGCKNIAFDEKNKRYCIVLGEIPEKIINAEQYSCQEFVSDKDSCWYSKIKDKIEESKI